MNVSHVDARHRLADRPTVVGDRQVAGVERAMDPWMQSDDAVLGKVRVAHTRPGVFRSHADEVLAGGHDIGEVFSVALTARAIADPEGASDAADTARKAKRRAHGDRFCDLENSSVHSSWTVIWCVLVLRLVDLLTLEFMRQVDRISAATRHCGLTMTIGIEDCMASPGASFETGRTSDQTVDRPRVEMLVAGVFVQTITRSGQPGFLCD